MEHDHRLLTSWWPKQKNPHPIKARLPPFPRHPPRRVIGEQTFQSGRLSGDTLMTFKNLKQSRDLVLRQKFQRIDLFGFSELIRPVIVFFLKGSLPVMVPPTFGTIRSPGSPRAGASFYPRNGNPHNLGHDPCLLCFAAVQD
jgi:hypothetical protein